ncbi:MULTISPECIES: hypothetical protein [Nostocales]|uniref:Uncharacterized protein n=3 Tax=Nostocales TaxID=1161 RepID=A0A0C1N3T6_9CYAN|nr:hypothetical protein [Tolypothrix bouteillei]KAF3889466.1 hypothetical protein DA73_0400031275 [Tolypothrix bouteillei VB521301]
MDEYILVDCGFHDELEALATMRQKCCIIYRGVADEVLEIQDQIVDIYSANKADFLRLRNSTEIRLDRIISVNGKPIAYCSN